VQQGLSLPPAAIERVWWAILFDLGQVPFYRTPTRYLSLIIDASAAQVIAAIPLKPPARIFVIDPTFLLPD